jgi:hypothetical protein
LKPGCQKAGKPSGSKYQKNLSLSITFDLEPKILKTKSYQPESESRASSLPSITASEPLAFSRLPFGGIKFFQIPGGRHFHIVIQFF